MKRVAAAFLLGAAVLTTSWSSGGEPEPPAPQPLVTPERYPTLNMLDFQIDKRLGRELEDEYNCPQPLNTSGAVLSKPEELPIDLPTIFRLTGCDNLEVRIARARLAEAEAKTLSAKLQIFPTLTPYIANSWHSGREQNSSGRFFDVSKQNDKFGGLGALDWNLGETFFKVLAARRRVQAQEANIQVTLDDVKSKAVAAFYDLVQARMDLVIIEQRLKQANDTVGYIDERAKGAAALLSEVSRARAVRAEVKQRVAQAREKTRLASSALTEILHIDPMVTLVPHENSRNPVKLVPDEKELWVLVTDGIARRPELKESRAYWNALEKERKAAWLAPLIPNIKVDLFDGSFGHHPSDGHHQVELQGKMWWKIGPGGIGDPSRSREAVARQDQEALNFGKIVDKIAREIVDSHTRVKTAEELIELSKEEITAAEESVRLSSERFKSSSGLAIELINAEEELFNARSRAAQHIVDFNKAEYALLHRIGGYREWDFAVPTAVEVAPAAKGK